MNDHGQQKASTVESSRAAAERARILAAFRAVFTGDDGRTVLAVLHASAGTTPGHRQSPALLPAGRITDPALAAFFVAGRQSILDEIESHLATPEDVTPEEPKAVGK